MGTVRGGVTGPFPAGAIPRGTAEVLVAVEADAEGGGCDEAPAALEAVGGEASVTFGGSGGLGAAPTTPEAPGSAPVRLPSPAPPDERAT